ncbi:hypothetical protein M8C21_034053, partial [Ambrosia artemisiifolia]
MTPNFSVLEDLFSGKTRHKWNHDGPAEFGVMGHMRFGSQWIQSIGYGSKE